MNMNRRESRSESSDAVSVTAESKIRVCDACNTVHPGFTLLEVMLSLMILAMAMATLGHLFQIAGRNATAAQELTKAQMYAQAVMDQVDAGILTTAYVTGATLELDPDWTYSIQSQPLPVQGLMSIQVIVEPMDNSRRAMRTTLTRWMLDPDYVAQRIAEEEAAAAEEDQG